MLFSIKLVLKPTSMKANVTKKLGEKVRAKNSLYTANRHSVKIKQCWKWKKLLTFIIFWTLFQVDESAIFYLDVACVNDDSSCLAHLTLSIVLTIFWKKRVRSESQPCHIYYPYFTSKNETMLHLGVFDRAVVFFNHINEGQTQSCFLSSHSCCYKNCNYPVCKRQLTSDQRIP